MGSTVSQLSAAEVEDLAQSTPFSQDEVRRLYRRFCRLDRDGSGALDTEELATIPELAMNPLGPRILGLFDTDGDGSINFTEFLTAMSVFCDRPDMPAEHQMQARIRKLEFVFRVFDVDGDGVIGAGELFDVFSMLIPSDAGVTPEQVQRVVDRTLRTFGTVAVGEGRGIPKTAFIEHLQHSDSLMEMDIKF